MKLTAILLSVIIFLSACGSAGNDNSNGDHFTNNNYSFVEPVTQAGAPDYEVEVIFGHMPSHVGQFRMPDGTVCVWATGSTRSWKNAGLSCDH